MGSSPIDTMTLQLQWLEWLCKPGPKAQRNGRGQSYAGPSADVVKERDRLRREVRRLRLQVLSE